MKLRIRKSKEIQITRQDTILFGQGSRWTEVAGATVGNFDCTPYEPKSLFWYYSAALYRHEGVLWVVIVETEATIEIIDREWVRREEETQTIYHSKDGGTTWVQHTGTGLPVFEEATRIHRVVSSG